MRTLLALIVVASAGCDVVFGLDKAHPGVTADAPIDAPIASGWKQVAAGYQSTCGIKADDTLWCWGNNDVGELGVGIALEMDAPVQVGTETWLSVAMGYHTTCGIQPDHSLWCWGANDNGTIGDGNLSPTAVPVRVLDNVRHVTTSLAHTCAITMDDALYCWGFNYYGQVGNSSTTTAVLPQRIGTDSWQDVTVGDYHTCGIKKSDQSLWCWGYNGWGQFGDAAPGQSNVPTLISTPGQLWAEVQAGFEFTCARNTVGQIRCAGYSAHGELGAGVVSTSSATPELLAVTVDDVDLDQWVHLSARGYHTCAWRPDGAMYCWGRDHHLQLGTETMTALAERPLLVDGTWGQAAAGHDHTCAIDGDNQLWCWGGDGRGALGDGGASPTTPEKIAGSWSQLSAGPFHTCALDPQGYPSCAGRNQFGGLGDGTKIDRQVFTRPPGSGPWQVVSAGVETSCCVVSTQAYCWGQGANGAIGDNTTVSKSSPTYVSMGWSTIGTGEHTCALTTTGAVGCWGYNYYGQVGNSTNTNQLIPVGVTGLAAGVSQLSVGFEHSCALSGANATCWGRGLEGQLGNGTGASANAPVAVYQGISGGFESIYTGAFQSCARTLDHHLWCWGGNAFGGLGLGDQTPRYVPALVSMDTWSKISIGAYHTCGIQMNGSLWCWGGNARGQLGIGTRFNRIVPAQVGTDTNWASVIAGHHHTCALKTDQSLWCWGWNEDGQLGDGKAFRAAVMVP